ncbi:6381_t:CDS:2 [Gigaspora rosea]|nr:6381_t:CDS:2 [Gigaspora rosea]
MPLVFSLMTEKFMESYRRLFQGLMDFAKEHNIDLSTQIVLTDFEVAVINADQSEFDEVHILVETHNIVQWFENNYAHGRVRRVHRNGTLVWSKLFFPSNFWSVSENIEFAYLENSECSGGELQKEQNKVEISIKAVLQGAPRLY